MVVRMTQAGKLEVPLTPLPVGEKRSSPRIPVRSGWVRAYTEDSKSTETTEISESKTPNASHRKNPSTRGRRELVRPLKSCLRFGGSTGRSAEEASCVRKAVRWDGSASDPLVVEVPYEPRTGPMCKHWETPQGYRWGCRMFSCGVGNRSSEHPQNYCQQSFKSWLAAQRKLGHNYVAGGGLIDMYLLDEAGDPLCRNFTIRHPCHESCLGPGKDERARLFDEGRLAAELAQLERARRHAGLLELDSCSF